MKQFEFFENQLVLRVKKSPIIIRLVLYVITFLCFFFPILTISYLLIAREDFHIKYVLFLFFFGFVGFYMLRVSLWNTFGNEIITFQKENITYIADYGWFKDAVKSIRGENFEYFIQPVGYESDKIGVLVISKEDNSIECVVKMPEDELKELIDSLNFKQLI
jgi:hypothetical protein